MSKPELSAQDLITELFDKSDPLRATHATRFFKCDKGQYGEGDQFIGVTVPDTRAVAKNYHTLPIGEIQKLLEHPMHEVRLAGVVIMADIYKKRTPSEQKTLYELYLTGLKKNWINNWDIVDVSSPHIIGAYCRDNGAEPLYTMAKSDNLWIKRTTIVSTFAFLRTQPADATHTLAIATLLLNDTHDLIHKATGWLLREAGKKAGEQELTAFLDEHATTMPRTMLRYSLERLSKKQREYYMNAQRLTTN